MEARPYRAGDPSEGLWAHGNHPLHGLCCATISYILGDFVRKKGLGVVLCNNAAFEVAGMLWRPDISFIRTDRLHLIPEDGYPNGSPDLAVEVVDENDPPGAIEARVQMYLASGSTMVWVADPLYRRVIVYQPHGSFLSVGQNDMLSGGETLPGFSVTVGDFFRYR